MKSNLRAGSRTPRIEGLISKGDVEDSMRVNGITFRFYAAFGARNHPDALCAVRNEANLQQQQSQQQQSPIVESVYGKPLAELLTSTILRLVERPE